MKIEGLEIERKYLLSKDDALKLLNDIGNYSVKEIEQTYLETEDNKVEKRVRKVVEEGHTYFKYTIKEEIKETEVTRKETETSITEEEYKGLLEQRDKRYNTINKKRYTFEYLGQTFELDMYDFWNDKVTMEIELDSEDKEVNLPEFKNGIIEITKDKRFKNKQLAICHSIEIDV